jgi:hypothetical protein
MKKLSMILAAVALLITAGLFTGSAKAMTGASPIGLRAAIEDVAVTDQVHCVWGWRHHGWRYGRPRWDGCYHGYRGYYVPRLYYGPRFHGHRFYRGGGGHRFHGGGHRGGRRHR